MILEPQQGVKLFLIELLFFDLTENFANLTLGGIRPGGLLFESVQVGKELLI